MIYLSRLVLDRNTRRVQSEIAWPYEMHRSIMRAFADGLTRERERVLWRVDMGEHDGVIKLLVQSRARPHWSWARDAAGYLLPESQIADGKPNPATAHVNLSEKLAAGRVLTFRLRANPTKRVGKKDHSNKGKRIGLEDEEQQRAWLERKAQAGGFRIRHLLITQEQAVEDALHRGPAGSRVGHELNLLAVRFEGLLHVTDVDTLARTVEAGIGSGKGFGFGLLSLAPAPGAP